MREFRQTLVGFLSGIFDGVDSAHRKRASLSPKEAFYTFSCQANQPKEAVKIYPHRLILWQFQSLFRRGAAKNPNISLPNRLAQHLYESYSVRDELKLIADPQSLLAWSSILMWNVKRASPGLLSVSLLAFLSLTTACGEQNQGTLKGHFENYEEANLASYRGRLTAIAEHEPSEAIMMSYSMFTEHKREDMALEFLQSGIDRLWVVVPNNYSQEEDARDLAGLRAGAGSAATKIKIVREQVPGDLREWARDFGPHMARDQQGNKVLMDLNYYSDRPADDSVPQELARLMGSDRVSLPIYSEGGNFMNNSLGSCMMTEKVLRANSSNELPGDRILSKDEILAYYKDFFGCKEVHIFPVMPEEGTQHIDLWGKFLNDNTIIVAEISEDILGLKIYKEEHRKIVGEVRDYLNERTKDIEKLGFKVVRVPMPAPSFASDGFSLFRSYTNSLILNGTAFVPEYIKPYNELDGVNGDYIDAPFIAGYKQAVEKAYLDSGLKVRWIESDSLISKGGAVHCTTMQIAR